MPPAPWGNVIANPQVGCLATDSGLGCTWVGNSQTNRLTPWNNDPVSDPPAEVVGDGDLFLGQHLHLDTFAVGGVDLLEHLLEHAHLAGLGIRQAQVARENRVHLLRRQHVDHVPSQIEDLAFNMNQGDAAVFLCADQATYEAALEALAAA